MHADGELRFYTAPVHVRHFSLEVEHEGGFAREVAFRSWITSSEESVIRVPDLFVFISCLVPWVGWLVWHSGRKQRISS